MATIRELASRLQSEERLAGVPLDEEVVVAQAVSAARFYYGFALPEPWDQALRTFDDVTPESVLSVSEWAIIRPLFMLYVEREVALQLEASRGLGVDPYGRTSSEIAAEITQLETSMPQIAFAQPIVSV